MSDINLQLVREFFELNLFRVLTHWQQDSTRPTTADHCVRLYVENCRPAAPCDPDFVLQPKDVRGIERAMIEVRAWHADRFYPSVIENNPVLSECVKDEALAVAASLFDDQPFTTILVISELPVSLEQRNRSINLLQATGIGHVLEFPVLLHDVLTNISVNSNYLGSQTLQTLRLLKRYRFIRHQQMEFTFPTEAPTIVQMPLVDTAVEPDSE